MAVHEASDLSPALLLSTAPFWGDFLPATSLATCCMVSNSLRKAAEDDRVWKNLCRRRWRRVNVQCSAGGGGGGSGDGGHHEAYASLNGWRDPASRLRSSILSTSPGFALAGWRATRAAQAVATGGGHARNISGMDVAPSGTVVVCSADFAWIFSGECPSRGDAAGSSSRSRGISGDGAAADVQARGRAGTADAVGRYAPEAAAGTAGAIGASGAVEVAGAMVAMKHARAIRGFRLPSSCVTEARFSEDGERCFFGTMTGEIHVHERGSGEDGGGGHGTPAARRTPMLALTSTGGSPVAVRQVVASFDGGCPRGSRLGVLCRPPSGWQPNLEGSDGGYLQLIDSQAQAVTRRMRLGGGSLGGLKFPTMERGGAAVSTAPLRSEGVPFGSAGSGDLFAIGFSGGTVALYDARCRDAGGMVTGFMTRHRWLERLRSAGPLLMASYGRSKNIETWDIRKLPSCPTYDEVSVTPAPRPLAPPRLGDLTCAANSPDFWVEPHGLCVAIYGPPRHSQCFGAKHAFWPWPKARPPREEEEGRPVVSGGGGAAGSGAPVAAAGAAGAAVMAEEGVGKGAGAKRRSFRGVERPVPGVVSDCDYRLRLSTGVKFTDTRLVTVLDSSRVLVDEMAAAGSRWGCGGHSGAVSPVVLCS